eukprot:TRINITY_DN20951_c0_g1_i2.p1 TRINITY_DN20951_c0_g1~~TRINITY_DN20951_c0_g1_i2.p1  ORF type:complete len:549 (+),score=98.29 TRINITY_DN20951_c0_g1_i2:123-1769(+)
MGSWLRNFLGETKAPVKNTFIHYAEEADAQGQPSAFQRRSCSERDPPLFAQGLWGEDQPAFLPEPSGASAPLSSASGCDASEQDMYVASSASSSKAPSRALEPQSVDPAFLSLAGRPSGISAIGAEHGYGGFEQDYDGLRQAEPQEDDSHRPEPVVMVKNTFIHWDESVEQPSIFARKSVSTPTYFQHVGAGLTMAATLNQAPGGAAAPVELPSEPPWEPPPPPPSALAATAPRPSSVPGGPGSIGACGGESCGASFAGGSSASTAAVSEGSWVACKSPSVGAANHDEGRCRPCAHNWRVGGCAKGFGCSFCHMCEDGALKQRKREKRERIRADIKRQTEGAEGDDGASRLENASATAASAATAAVAEAPAGAGGAKAAPDATSGEGAAAQPQRPFIALGELVVAYGNSGAAQVSWSVDLRRLRQQGRSGLSRRFAVKLGNVPSVPFLLTVIPESRPSGGGGYGSVGSPSDVAQATVQVTCSDPEALFSQNKCCHVALAAGGDAFQEICAPHNFAANPHVVAALPPTWTAGSPPGTCLLQILLEATPP